MLSPIVLLQSRGTRPTIGKEGLKKIKQGEGWPIEDSDLQKYFPPTSVTYRLMQGATTGTGKKMVYVDSTQRNEYWAQCDISGQTVMGYMAKGKMEYLYADTHVLLAGETVQVNVTSLVVLCDNAYLSDDAKGDAAQHCIRIGAS